MDHGSTLSRFWHLALTLGCVVAVSGLACGGTGQRLASKGGAGGSAGSGGSGGGGSGGSTGGTSGSGGSAGSGGSGGSAGSGGSGGSGGASSGGVSGSGGGSGGSAKGGSGGSGSGGSGGKGGGGSGGAGGSGGGSGGTTTIPATPCSSTDDCSSSNGKCEPVLKVCVRCIESSDCADGEHCLGNRCVSFKACGTSRDCDPGKEVCDPNSGICVECARQNDCAADQACVLNKCVSTAGCNANGDCDGKLCDTDNHRCVECLADDDCNSDTKKCINNACRIPCTSDKPCTPTGLLCDTGISGCVECKATSDCPSSTYCEGGLCKADICDSNMSVCANNGVAACNEAGNGWATPKSCGGQGCQASGGVATCGGQPPVDGGPNGEDGGNPPVDGGGGDISIGCTTEKATPCTAIPKYVGTQTVDGNGDDMCQVPAFVFNKAAAATVNNYNNLQDSEFPSATVRVAWSSAGLHAFIDVADASVQSVFMKDPEQATQRPYQGDSIELFFSSSDTATGAPGGDTGAVHITFGATGPSVSVKTTNSGGLSTAYAELLAEQYKAVKTDSGYAIEALIPWQGSAPSDGAKVRFDLAINVADTNFGTVDDMRDAQMVLNQGSVDGQTSCPGNAEPWCDDRTWCSTTLAP
jgi:hypothetical protein